MITLPDRLGEVAEAVAEGQDVDLGRVLCLQALDAAMADEQFAREAVTRQEEADDQLSAG